MRTSGASAFVLACGLRVVMATDVSAPIAAKIIARVYPLLPVAIHTLLDPYLKSLETQLPIDMNDTNGTHPVEGET